MMPPVDLYLRDKVAIVTGSSRGLGLAAATALGAEGCRITLCARGEAPLREATRQVAAAAGSPDRVLTVVADVSTAEGVREVVDRTVAAFGGIDVLVNNVGLARGGTLTETEDASWYEAFEQ